MKGYITKEQLSNSLKQEIDNIGSQLEHIASNVKKLGMNEGYTLIDCTYTVNGTSYNSQQYSGISQKNILQNIINNNDIIYIPKGVYFIDGTIEINGNKKIYGAGNKKSILIGCQFLVRSTNGLEISNLGFIGKGVEFAPPKQITTVEKYRYDNEHMWYMDYTSIGYSHDAIQLAVPKQEYGIENVLIDNCYFSMHSNAVAMLRNTDGTGVYSRNIVMQNCETNYIWWHGMGSRYVRNVLVDKCNFRNHWVGMMADFSTGTRSSKMTNCYGNKVANFFKAESFSEIIGVNGDCIIDGNTYISFHTGDKNYKYYVGHTTGNSHIISNNKIYIFDKIKGFRSSSTNTLYTNNYIETTDANQYLFECYNYCGIDGDLILKNNVIRIAQSIGLPILVNNRSENNSVIITGNTITQGICNLIYRSDDVSLNVSNVVINDNTFNTNALVGTHNTVATFNFNNIDISNNNISYISLSLFHLAKISAKNIKISNNNCTRHALCTEFNKSNRSYFVKIFGASEVGTLNICDNYIEAINEEFVYVYDLNGGVSKINMINVANNIVNLEGIGVNGFAIYLDSNEGCGVVENNKIFGDKLLTDTGGEEKVKEINLRNKHIFINNILKGNFSIIGNLEVTKDDKDNIKI